MRRYQALALACVAALGMLSACTVAPTVRIPSDAVTEVPAPLRLTPRDGVRYSEPGVYAAGDTSVAVGVLRYRAESDTAGTWILASRDDPGVLAADMRPVATVTGAPGFDSEFWPLDGQYVAIEGTAAVKIGQVTQVGAHDLSLVSDIFYSDTNEYTAPGLYNLPNGSLYVRGWIGDETSETVTTLYDRSPDATGPPDPRPVARVLYEKRDHASYLTFGSAEVFMVEEGSPPVVEAIHGLGYSPGPGFHMTIGMPAAWRSVERAGVKDLPGGRTRVVGVVWHDYSTPREPGTVLLAVNEPWYRGLGGYRMLISMDSTLGVASESGYIAVEGTLHKSAAGYDLEADRLERIPTPSPR